ncbi:hypothetical protein PLESTB_000704900 [Pleodorina starrii]|uniref:Uncharacterized protein n=1 Tax=Pleodorina starrii TaxID=330485 RepID=A0A9W6EWC1_9CHLO|nr:hypothetical protein PLESTB_000049500 [Pleodorina starrii]GLC53073.1 hypothetical protein PLESTB_000704900 [Pleodorina starrii]
MLMLSGALSEVLHLRWPSLPFPQELRQAVAESIRRVQAAAAAGSGAPPPPSTPLRPSALSFLLGPNGPCPDAELRRALRPTGGSPGCDPLPPRICTNPLCVNLAGPSERLLSELYCGGGAGGEGASYVLQRELPGGALGGGAHQECGGRDR